MCLVIDINKHPTLNPIQLNEDITVYKIVFVAKLNLYITPFRAMYIHFDETNPYVTKSFCLTLFEVATQYKSVFGYHAYSNLKRAKDVLCMYNSGFVILKCTIPKGQYIYFGTDEEICCSQLIIHNEICV